MWTQDRQRLSALTTILYAYSSTAHSHSYNINPCFDLDAALRRLLLNYSYFISAFSHLIFHILLVSYISLPVVQISLSFAVGLTFWNLDRQPSRRSQLPKTLFVSVSFVFASDHQHPSSSLRVDVNVREPSVDERMKMRDRKIPSNDSAFTLQGRNSMNGEGSKVAAEPMIIRAIEAGTFSSDYSTLILRGGIKYEHGEGCLLLATAT